MQFSCFPPNGYFDKDKQTQCIFLLPKKMVIEKTCADPEIDSIYGPAIDVKYDTIKIINGSPSDRFRLFESTAKTEFPFRLDTIIKNRSTQISIGLKTDKGRGYSYALSIDPADWTKDTLFFTFFYRQ